jgi:hypothetical protein
MAKTLVPLLAPALVVAAESTEHESGANPYLIGGAALVILLAMLLAVVAFGGGREHS